MVKIASSKDKGSNKAIRYLVAVTAVVCSVLSISSLFRYKVFEYVSVGSSTSTRSSPSISIDHKVDSKCTDLEAIKPSGPFPFDPKVHKVSSFEAISPPFKIGSKIGPNVKYHMSDDVSSFTLIKELLEGRQENALTFDIGANQGFYTFYLATLGMQVHSFEISEKNFVSLQHGTTFNPKQVSDRVNLYSVGLGEKNARFSMSGNDYEGFLKEGKGGNIVGATFDCFAHHSKLDLSNVAFVKLDVEGFEIGVLKGARNSLFHESSSVGGMLMEVGPKRWSRAGIDLATGTTEMKYLATRFKKSYLITRNSGSFMKTCPGDLAKKILSDTMPRDMGQTTVHVVRTDEWDPLLAEMEKNGKDCNFWYTNK